VTPELGKIVRTGGIAGQVQYTTDVTYPDEPPRAVSFVGYPAGGPVVMLSGDSQTFVTDPGRFGKFGPDWVRRFFAA
jgi:hypothetical protein